MTWHPKTVAAAPSGSSAEHAQTPDPILLLDDEPDFAEELITFLESHGEPALAFTDAATMFAYMVGNPVRALVLDQNLGRTRGLDVLLRARARWPVPCIILSGMTDQVDRILGLEAGADDYIHKSMHPREILARLRAVLRRGGTAGAADAPVSTPAAPSAWRLNAETRELHAPDGTPCHLTTAEFELLATLVRHRGQPLDRARLCEAAFHRPWRAGDRAVDTIIVQLRRHLEPDAQHPTVIRSVRNLGYIFTGFPAASR